MTIRQLILRTLFVLLVAALTGGAAYLLSEQQAERYAATTQLLFSPTSPALEAIGITGANQDQERRGANNAASVDSFDVARRTAEAMDDPAYTPGQVDRNVEVSNQRGSDVVTIRALAPTPEQAAEVASLYRRQFFFTHLEREQRVASDARKALVSALARLPRRARNGARGDELREQIGALSVLMETGAPPRIIEGIRASASPVAPQTTRNTLFGGLLGLVLGIGLVALRGATRSPATP